MPINSLRFLKKALLVIKGLYWAWLIWCFLVWVHLTLIWMPNDMGRFYEKCNQWGQTRLIILFPGARLA